MNKAEAKEFRLKPNAKKQEIIDRYKKLLGAYQEAVEQNEESRKQLTELERRMEEQATELADEATVSFVIDNLSKLRGQIGTTLNDLTDQMAGEAEKLETLRRSVATQEKRLKDLYDIEVAADALQKLVEAFEERRSRAESDFEALLAELNSELESRKQEGEAQIEEQRANLTAAIEEQRAKWLEEKARVKREKEEHDTETSRAREREEAEYVYARDRARKLEEDEYEERKKSLEKELAERRESAERELASRESAVADREKRLDQLEAEVAGFPERLEREIERARARTAAELRDKAAHDARIVEVEHSWEKKNFEQRISHLEQLVTERDQKIEKLGRDLAAAGDQVNEVAKKAIEGASLNRAFTSVNEIALEQARRPDLDTSDKK
jgi:chromosome segregation ATPase